MKKLIGYTALLLVAAIAFSFVPSAPMAEGTVCVSQSEDRASELAELMTFAGELMQMRKQYSPERGSAVPSDPYSTARIIVKYHGELAYPNALSAVSGYNDWHIIAYADAASAKEACLRYSAMPGVEYAEPDMMLHADATHGSGSFLSWGYEPESVCAYELNEWLYELYGGDISAMPRIKVAVIDSGVQYSHSFLQGRLLPGYDFVNGDDDPEDDYHHGTHVSGTVVDGTLENVKITPVKVLDNTGYGETSTVVMGIEYSRLTGCHVANLSLGGDCDGPEGTEHCMMEEAINAAMDAGVVVTIAAGNESSDAGGHCPANIERGITVAACNRAHNLAGYSNYGDCVDIIAPGSDILSSYTGNRFVSLSGTSMAAPHVAAAAAMIKTFSPLIGADRVAQMLCDNAEDIGVTNAGCGMLSVTGLCDTLRFIPGDVDMNGRVNGNDALFVLRYSLHVIDGEKLELRAADLDGNGTVNANDALYALRHVLGISPLPENAEAVFKP